MASTLVLVGWDEVKCRPIYRDIPKSATTTAGSTKKNAKKSKEKVNKRRRGGGGATTVPPRENVQSCSLAAPTTSSSSSSSSASPTSCLEEEENILPLPLLLVNKPRGNKCYGRTRELPGKRSSSRRAAPRPSRPVSLSPVEGLQFTATPKTSAGKKVSWGDDDDDDDDVPSTMNTTSDVIIADDKASSSLTAVEDEAMNKNDHNGLDTSSSTFTRKRRKGYGTKTSSGSAAAIVVAVTANTQVDRGGYKNNVDLDIDINTTIGSEASSKNDNDKAAELSTIDQKSLPLLQEESRAESTEMENGPAGSNDDLTPVKNDEGSMMGSDKVPLKNCKPHSPTSPVNFESHIDSDGASPPLYDEEETGREVEVVSGHRKLSCSSNSNSASFDCDRHNEGPTKQKEPLPVEDDGPVVSCPRSSLKFNSYNEKASPPSDEAEIGSDDPDHSRLPDSPKSNVSFDGTKHNDETIQQSKQMPIRDNVPGGSPKSPVIFSSHSEKEIATGTVAHSKSSCSPKSNVSFDSNNHHEVPIQQKESTMQDSGSDVQNDHFRASISTPPKLQDHPSPPTSIDTWSVIDTPNSGIGQNQLEPNDYGSPECTKNGTPLSEDEVSTFCPDSSDAKSRYATNEFADFDVTFDEPESRALPKEKRRSYGDVKPVWMWNKSVAATSVDVSDDSGKVGWDDAKCRLIYKAPRRQNAPSRDSPYSHSPVNNGNDSHILPKRTQKKRVYTSLFKKSGLSQAARDKMEIDSPSSTARSPHAPSATEKGRGMTVSSSEKSNCDDFTKKTSDKEVDDASIDSDQQPNNGTKLNVELEIEAIMNDSNAHRAQPTSKSSLESARAFFRHLDSNHNLTILDQSDNEPSRKTKVGVIRTPRRMEECEQLRVQYVEYYKTVRRTGVSPISLKEFAKNWSLYFTTEKGVCGDGLLDED